MRQGWVGWAWARVRPKVQGCARVWVCESIWVYFDYDYPSSYLDCNLWFRSQAEVKPFQSLKLDCLHGNGVVGEGTRAGRKGSVPKLQACH